MPTVKTLRVEPKGTQTIGEAVAGLLRKEVGYHVMATVPARLGSYGIMGFEVLAVDVILERDTRCGACENHLPCPQHMLISVLTN